MANSNPEVKNLKQILDRKYDTEDWHPVKGEALIFLRDCFTNLSCIKLTVAGIALFFS